LAEQVNSTMPNYVVELASTALNEERKAVNGSKVLILGVAYKKYLDDMRQSPALSIISSAADAAIISAAFIELPCPLARPPSQTAST